MDIINLFSPNYKQAKRSANTIKTIVIHYTGMQSERDSLNRLCNPNSKVSCHYFINKKGKVIRLVKDKNIAWHAGKSFWRQYINLNKNSIGIELDNKGHQFGYTKFKNIQIKNLIILCSKLIKKYRITNVNVVGHSDIATDRKIDPGEKFPWEYLAKNKIGLWHNLKLSMLKKLRKKRVLKYKFRNQFIKNLDKIGYHVLLYRNNIHLINVIKAFQRHFRKELINGIIDEECLEISINLLKKIVKKT